MPDMEELESLHNCNIIDVSDIVGYDTIFILDNTWDTIMETDSDHLLESLNHSIAKVLMELQPGVQDMTRFGDEQQDYELIFDYLTIDYDPYVANNPNQFEIIGGELKLKSGASLSKYL